MKPIPENHCQFYIVRHGQTVWNSEHRMQGQKDSELTELGVKQARELGEQLKDVKFAATFSSDLQRAKKTARLVTMQKQAAITATKLLRERGMGVLEGKVIDDLSDELRELLYKVDSHQHYQELEDYQIESLEQALGRIIQFLRQTALAYPNHRVLLVTHAGLIGHLLVKLAYLGASHFRHLKIDNLSYVILNSDGIELEIVDAKGISLRNQENLLI